MSVARAEAALAAALLVELMVAVAEEEDRDEPAGPASPHLETAPPAPIPATA